MGARKLQGVDRLGAGDAEIGGRKVIGGRREAGSGHRRIRRERGGGRQGGSGYDPVDAVEGGPAADDTIIRGRCGREDDRTSGGDGKIEGGASAAGTQRTEGQGSGATSGGDHLDPSGTSRRGERTQGLGRVTSAKTQVGQRAAGRITERFRVKNDRGGIRQDVAVADDLQELKHAIGDRGGAGEGIVTRGRIEHPGAGADLLQIGSRGRELAGDGVVAGIGAAEDEGLRAGIGRDGAVDGERTRAAGIEVSVSRGDVEQDRRRQSGGRAGVSERAGSRRGVTDVDGRSGTERADASDHQGALADLRQTGVGAEHALQRGLAQTGLGEAMRGTGRDDAAGQQRVTGTLEGERAGGSALVRPPDVPAEGEQAGEVGVDVEVAEIAGGTAKGGADEVAVAGERSPVAIATAEIVIGDIVATALGEVTEGDGLTDGSRGSGSIAETVVDEQAAADVIAEVEVAVAPVVQGRADFETAVDEVDVLRGAVEAEVGRIGHADPTATSAHLTVETVLIALNPERGGVGHAFLEQTVLTRIVGDDLTGDDEITVAVEQRNVAGAEGKIP